MAAGQVSFMYHGSTYADAPAGLLKRVHSTPHFQTGEKASRLAFVAFILEAQQGFVRLFWKRATDL
jgi:hypothetical protein